MAVIFAINGKEVPVCQWKPSGNNRAWQRFRESLLEKVYGIFFDQIVFLHVYTKQYAIDTGSDFSKSVVRFSGEKSTDSCLRMES